MSSFSRRMNLVPEKAIQNDEIDDDLRSSLWNVLHGLYKSDDDHPYVDLKADILFVHVWTLFLKRPIDELNHRTWGKGYIAFQRAREFFFKCEWYAVYDLLEFIANSLSRAKRPFMAPLAFTGIVNHVLEREVSAYRFVGLEIVPITSKEELNSVLEASRGGQFKPVEAHLQKALHLLSDRKIPDYPNSIKESISAVESMCKIVTNDEKATLGQAVKVLEKDGKLHPSLKDAFSKLYGYTSDAGGIRHANGLTEEKHLTFDDAKFMLVCCSAFVNYLKSAAN